jgi:hypothetical protein
MKTSDRRKDLLVKALTRREALSALGAAGAAFVAGCGESPTSPSSLTTTTPAAATTSTNAACAVTPTETPGPFPSLTDLLRSDIREGRSGTPLTREGRQREQRLRARRQRTGRDLAL